MDATKAESTAEYFALLPRCTFNVDVVRIEYLSGSFMHQRRSLGLSSAPKWLAIDLNGVPFFQGVGPHLPCYGIN